MMGTKKQSDRQAKAIPRDVSLRVMADSGVRWVHLRHRFSNLCLPAIDNFFVMKQQFLQNFTSENPDVPLRASLSFLFKDAMFSFKIRFYVFFCIFYLSCLAQVNCLDLQAQYFV